MRKLKLISVICAIVMLLTSVQIPSVAAASYTAIDLSENKTRFTATDAKTGTFVVYTQDTTARATAPADNSEFTFSSSDESVMSVDELGNYTINGAGAAIITVESKENTSIKRSMLVYCGGDNLDYLSIDNYEDYVSGDDGFVNSIPKPDYIPNKDEGRPQNYKELPKYDLKDDVWRLNADGTERKVVAMMPMWGVAPKAGTSENSFILSLWTYDNYNGATRPKLGIGNSDGEHGFFYGVSPLKDGAGAGDKTSPIFEAGYLENVEHLRDVKIIAREKGWHQITLVVNHEEGAEYSEFKYYYDGEVVVHGTTATEIKPLVIQPSASWYGVTVNTVPVVSEGKNRMNGMLQEMYLAKLPESTPFKLESVSVGEGKPLKSGDSIKITFNDAPDSQNLEAVVTENSTGEVIETTTVVDGAVLKITPKSPLIPGREYELEITGTVVKQAKGITDFDKTITFNQPITFTAEQNANYAEDTIITEDKANATISADAVYKGSGKGYIVLSQFDDSGVQKSISVKEIAQGDDEEERILTVAKNEKAVSFEEYVWSAINKEEISPLYDGVKTNGDMYDREMLSTLENTGESKLITTYNVDEGKVVLKLTSKVQRKGLPVIIRVVKPDKNIEDATEANFSEIYARAEQLETQEGGVLGYTFKLEGGKGTYKVIANLPFEEKALSSVVNFTSQEDVYKAIKDVQAKADEAVFAEARKLIDIDYSAFDKLKNQKIVLGLVAKAPVCTSLTEFEEIFSECVETVEILEKSDLEKIKAKKDEWGIGGTSLYKKFIEMENESDRKIITDKVLAKGFDDYATLKTAFEDVVTVGCIDMMVNFTELFPFITDINDVLELELPASEPTDAMEYLAERLGEVNGVDSLKAKYAEAIEAKGDGTGDDDDDDDGGSSGGSSGGGGSSSGGLKGGSGSGLTTSIGGDYIVTNKETAGAKEPDWVTEEKYLKTRKVFDDIENVPWAEDSIRELYNLGIISGKGEGIFAPNAYITREEIAKILILMAGIDVNSVSIANPFADVNSAAWYAPYVMAAYEKGIINGTGANTFGTGAYITREELCTLADRAAISSDIFLDDEFTILPFDDEAQISSWALNSVLKMRESFIVSGMGGNVFNPKAPVTRAQAAKIIYGVIAYAAQ